MSQQKSIIVQYQHGWYGKSHFDSPAMITIIDRQNHFLLIPVIFSAGLELVAYHDIANA